ncbi:hypothetical protein CYMTET_36607 [Cymbomonas tetramitiformis]|uniref:S-acyltransferase n=1 Tax=Cymbomonas tetramitiformis TaxID=36881 RepID=A0AAE0CI02_9CHLO|nr:hypothetical protein CYMTET_36607 [Cymbomonas tetramitiformis]
MQGVVDKMNATVVAVFLFFGFVYFTIVFLVVYPWLENSVPGVLNLTLFTALTIFALKSYIACVFRPAGSVPENWEPDVENLSQNFEVKRKGGQQLRYCKKCKNNKPPRAHHCRVCNRCVLRMDHHCVWINNCVGHNNYRSFFLFLMCCRKKRSRLSSQVECQDGASAQRHT